MAFSSTGAPNIQMEASASNVAGSGEQVQHYPYPSHVHTSDFVSIKLVGKTNYDVWKAQMTCFLVSHGMQGFVDGTITDPKENVDLKLKASEAAVEANHQEWKRLDTLVKGWIFGSLSEDVMGTVFDLQTAKDVWEKLMTPSPMIGPTISTTSNKDLAGYIPLCRAIQAGDWEKTREILNRDKAALTAKLTREGETALHIAIRSGASRKFVYNLLVEIDHDQLRTLVDNHGQHPIHIAAAVGNTAAAQLLVGRNPLVLSIADKNRNLPMHTASFFPHKETFWFLLKFTVTENGFSVLKGLLHPFEGGNGIRFIDNMLYYGFVDEAYYLVKAYPEVIRRRDDGHPLLEAVAYAHLHYSGTHYNFFQRWVYSYVPIENFDNTDKVQYVESQQMYKDKFVIKCRSRIYAVMEFMRLIFWRSLLLLVPQVKHLREDNEKHHTALTLLRFMCEEISKIDRIDEIQDHYSKAVTKAVNNNTPEPIKEIAVYFPQAIAIPMGEYYIIQVAIINRSEKVYNLMVYQLNISKSLLYIYVDKDGNNLLHLAGKLAPVAKLNAVSGAAQ